MVTSYWAITVYFDGLLEKSRTAVANLPRFKQVENTQVDTPTLKVFYRSEDNTFILCELCHGFIL